MVLLGDYWRRGRLHDLYMCLSVASSFFLLLLLSSSSSTTFSAFSVFFSPGLLRIYLPQYVYFTWKLRQICSTSSSDDVIVPCKAPAARTRAAAVSNAAAAT